MKKRYILGIFVLVAIIGGLKLVPHASAQKDNLVDHAIVSELPENTTPQTLPFTQNWTNAGLITTNDDWSAVPGIEGNLGQDITVVTGTDPQTLLTTSALPNDIDVIANQAAPDTATSGGVAEFDGIANPVVAIQGSGTADAPYVIFNVVTTGFTSINVAYNLRDVDGSIDNSIQPVALQYRVGNAGNFTNVSSGFVADASSGPSLATLVTPVSAVLGADANNQALVQIRVMTANAAGSDEWIGVDDINITGTSGGGGSPAGPKLFKANLSGAQEVPPVTTNAFGTGRVILNAAETQITASLYFNNLSGNATAGHIHGPAAIGVNGPVIFNLSPPSAATGSVVNFTTAVTPAQVTQLKSGLWYFNIHTGTNPGGEIRGQILVNTPRFDTDADGDSDWGIVRPGAGGAGGVTTWFTTLNQGTANDPFTINQFGTNGDVITPGDFDGDRKDDIAFWRPTATPTFFILRSSDSTVQQVIFGLQGDVPIVGDYSGDGRDDPSIYRAGATASSQSFFWSLHSSGPLSGVQVVYSWGLGSDFAVPGDFDGDGRHDLCVVRNIGGANTFIVFSSQSQVTYTTFGLAGTTPDRVVPGDYNGDGVTDFAVTRNEGGSIVWYYRPSGGGSDVRVPWGVAGSDIEAQGDYDGNGTTDPAIWRSAGGSTFFALTSPTTVRFQRWGLPTDQPSIYDLHGE